MQATVDRPNQPAERNKLSRLQSWAEYAVNSAAHSSIKQTWHPHRRLPETTEGQVGKTDQAQGRWKRQQWKRYHKRMSRFDFTREAETPKTWTNKTHQRSKIPDVSLGTGRQTEGNLKSWDKKQQRQNKINSRKTLGLACHAGNAQAQKRPRISTRVSRNRDRRMTPLGPVRHAEQRQTRHPASAHEAPSSPSMQGTMSGSEERATGKKPWPHREERRSIQQTATTEEKTKPESITMLATPGIPTRRAQEARIHHGRPSEHHPWPSRSQPRRCRRNKQGEGNETQHARATRGAKRKTRRCTYRQCRDRQVSPTAPEKYTSVTSASQTNKESASSEIGTWIQFERKTQSLNNKNAQKSEPAGWLRRDTTRVASRQKDHATNEEGKQKQFCSHGTQRTSKHLQVF